MLYFFKLLDKWNLLRRLDLLLMFFFLIVSNLNGNFLDWRVLLFGLTLNHLKLLLLINFFVIELNFRLLNG